MCCPPLFPCRFCLSFLHHTSYKAVNSHWNTQLRALQVVQLVMKLLNFSDNSSVLLCMHFLICLYFCWRLDQSGGPDYKVLLEHRVARDQKENRYEMCVFNFVVIVFQYNIFMTIPTYLAVKLVTRPVENGIENNPLFSGFRRRLKQNCTSSSKAENFFWDRLLTM